MAKPRIKTGDTVRIIAGKDKGKNGKVIQMFPGLSRVVVEGVNMSKRHLRSRRREEKGQIVEFAMPIHVSNVKLAVEETHAPKRAAARRTESATTGDSVKTQTLPVGTKEAKTESRNV